MIWERRKVHTFKNKLVCVSARHVLSHGRLHCLTDLEALHLNVLDHRKRVEHAARVHLDVARPLFFRHGSHDGVEAALVGLPLSEVVVGPHLAAAAAARFDWWQVGRLGVSSYE